MQEDILEKGLLSTCSVLITCLQKLLLAPPCDRLIGSMEFGFRLEGKIQFREVFSVCGGRKVSL